MVILGCNSNINFDQTLAQGSSLCNTFKVTCTKWKHYYSRVHGQIHLAAQLGLTTGVLSHFQNAPWKAGFLVLKGQKIRPPPPPPVTPKLKVSEVSQSGFWTISSHPTSVPSFSQNGWPQIFAPGTLSQTMTLKVISKNGERLQFVFYRQFMCYVFTSVFSVESRK